MNQSSEGFNLSNSNKISIITKSNIRYEGILYQINAQDQNITLCQVRSFGTEGRRPGDEIAPSPQIHEYIIFRGSDIKDLKVLEQNEAKKSGDVSQEQTKPTETPVQKTSELIKDEAPEQIQPEPVSNKAAQKPEREFDFLEMTEKFQNSVHLGMLESPHKVKYAPSDFFDSISTSTTESARDAHFDRIAQKKLDKETFGDEPVDEATLKSKSDFKARKQGGYNNYYNNKNYRGNRQHYNQQGGTKYGGGGGGRGGFHQNRGGYHGGGGRGGYGGQGGYKSGGYNQGGYSQGGYNQGGYNQGGYNQGGYHKNYQSGGQEGYAGGKEGYSGAKEGYTGAKEGYSGAKEGYSGAKEGYSGGKSYQYEEQEGYSGGNQGGYNKNYQSGAGGYKGGYNKDYNKGGY